MNHGMRVWRSKFFYAALGVFFFVSLGRALAEDFAPVVVSLVFNADSAMLVSIVAPHEGVVPTRRHRQNTVVFELRFKMHIDVADHVAQVAPSPIAIIVVPAVLSRVIAVAGHRLGRTLSAHLLQCNCLPEVLDLTPLDIDVHLRVAVERVIESGRLREKNLRLAEHP